MNNPVFISQYQNNKILFQMPSVLQQTQEEVEQLRREAAMKRIPVSQAVEDIKVSCTPQ